MLPLWIKQSVLKYIPPIKNWTREVYNWWRHKRLYYNLCYYKFIIAGSAIFVQFQVKTVLLVLDDHKVGAKPQKGSVGKVETAQQSKDFRVQLYSRPLSQLSRHVHINVEESDLTAHLSRSVVVQPVVRSTGRPRRFPLVQVSRRRPALALTT